MTALKGITGIEHSEWWKSNTYNKQLKFSTHHTGTISKLCKYDQQAAGDTPPVQDYKNPTMCHKSYICNALC